eukprot:gb/GFBE01009518.1/.p1 GENE.gb/GFBE01009518.1/~~gb/GFBE01009518.1/.p1  ORF type:complete len:707 (+),score=105.74 gb/GFBE01009518.1/:1-2121(+)
MALASAIQCGSSQLKTRQQDSLQVIVNKHIQDPALRELTSTQTSTERGLQRWEQAHLVSALDVINEYQRSRKARLFTMAGCGSHGPSWSRSYKNDPRTRMCELLKSWLRANAGCSTLCEDEVRNICGLCRDLLNHPDLFPARNPRSFLRSIADVYDHLQWQLQEVLEKDRSCADLAQRVLSLSRNLVSDTVAYLLMAPTDLQQTDALPSLEIVKLWQSLPNEGHPLPNRKDASLQKIMGEAWRTRCGAMIAALLRSPWCVRLFASADAENASRMAALENAQDLPGPDEVLRARMDEARAEFSSGRFKSSALVGALRGAGKAAVRDDLLQAVLTIFDLTYLLGEVMVQFHRISDGLGDYGMIRVSPWLHPFLEALMDKVQKLKLHLERLNETLDAAYVLGRAREQRVEKPAPSGRQCARARAAIERALIGRNSHANQLTQLVDELRTRSAPERLPHVAKGLGDACMTLQGVLASPEFRAHVGDAFPELPPLGGLGGNGGGSAAPSALHEIADLPEQAPAAKSSVRIQAIEDVDRADDLSTSASPVVSRDLHRTEDRHDTWSSSWSGSCCSQSRVESPTAIAKPTVSSHAGQRGRVLQFEVFRLVKNPAMKSGERRHDSRLLEVCDGMLRIYDKGSQAAVKLSVELPEGIDRVYLRTDTIMEMTASRPPPGVPQTNGVREHKDYVFEFRTAQTAGEFCEQLLRHGVGR